MEIDKNGNAQFGDTGDDITKIEGSKITIDSFSEKNNSMMK